MIILLFVLFLIFLGISIWLVRDLINEKIINYRRGWHQISDFDRPGDGRLVIVAVWYDYWQFDVGYYIGETDKFQSLIVPKDKFEDGRYDFDDVEYWMELDEPDLK